MIRHKLLLCGVALAAVAFSIDAHAGDRSGADYSRAFEQLGTALAEIQAIDTTSIAATELELVRTLIGQGQASIASDKVDDVAPVLQRAEVTVRYARAKVERVTAEERAAAALAGAKSAETAAAEVGVQVSEKQRRAKELEARGL